MQAHTTDGLERRAFIKRALLLAALPALPAGLIAAARRTTRPAVVPAVVPAVSPMVTLTLTAAPRYCSSPAFSFSV